MEENSDWINNLWFSDNVQYHLHDYVNSKNCVFWRPEPLQQVLQRPLHSSKVTAWWSTNSKTIIGPHWFEDGGEGTGTIKQENNRKVIHKLYASLNRMRDCYQSAMFDARWCHPSYSYCKCNTWTLNTNLLIEWFPEKKTDNPCAAQSPDFNPCDFPANLCLSKDVLKTSFVFVFRRCLQDILIKINIFPLLIRLEKTSWKCLDQEEYVRLGHTSCKDVFKTCPKHVEEVFQRCLQDILSSYKLFLLTRIQDVFNTLLRYIAKTIICRKICLGLILRNLWSGYRFSNGKQFCKTLCKMTASTIVLFVAFGYQKSCCWISK